MLFDYQKLLCKSEIVQTKVFNLYYNNLFAKYFDINKKKFIS